MGAVCGFYHRSALFFRQAEAVPAERCAVILCQKDNALYGDKLKYQDFIYSNQWIPLMEKCSLDEKIKLGALLDKKCGGGQIAHINLETQLSKNNAWKMLNYIASKGVIYFAFNSKISVCKNSHGFVGSKVCPKCGNPEIDTYQRIVGYLVPSSNYSTARHKEFGKRYWFNLNDSIIDSTV
jgi:ribonucleoside-triphosphate reductase